MTQAQAGLKIRLAGIDEPGATLFNAYNFLTQMSGLYAQALRHEVRPERKVVWDTLCDGTLNDLGDVFCVWEVTLRDGSVAKALVDDAAFFGVATRACRRIEVAMDRMTVWTPMTRWANLLRLSEWRWHQMLKHIGETTPALASKLESAVAASRGRAAQLAAFIAKERLEAERIDRCFSGDAHKRLGGSTGF